MFIFQKKFQITTKIKKSIMSFKPSSIETIDYALFDWLNDTLDISCTTNKGV